MHFLPSKFGALRSNRVTGLLRSTVSRLIGGKLESFWVRAFLYRAIRSVTTALGFPVSQTSVGVESLSWSIAFAIPGVKMAPKTAAPATEKNAFRDCSVSAFNTTLLFGDDATGANAEAVARVKRVIMAEYFIFFRFFLVKV